VHGRRGRRARPGRTRHTRFPRERWWAVAFLAPTAVGLSVFYIWPTVQTLYLGLTSTGPFGGSAFVGLDNYRQIADDDQFRQALRNTVMYAVLGLVGIPFALAIATVLNRPGRAGVSVYRTLMFLPVVTMPAAVSIVWRWLYNGDYGLINTMLRSIGIDGPYWLSDPRTALVSLAVVGIWSSVGYVLIILMAGLESIPRHYYEAAQIDGAGPLRQFWSVTVPLLSPTLFFVTVLSVIGSLQTFDLVYVMIGQGSPALPDTRTVVYLFYQEAFQNHDQGYAAALGFLILLIIVAATGLQFMLQRRWVHYD